MTKSIIGFHQPEGKAESKKRFLKFLSDNKYLIIGVLVIAFVVIWVKVKFDNVEKSYLLEKERLIIEHKQKVDSLYEAHIKQVTVVLSWAVRRHLLHNNLEEINLVFASFIKEDNVAKIQLINAKNAVVIISTDKNEEGQIVDNPDLLMTNTVGVFKPTNNQTKIVVTPIMGLNQKEGVLAVHYYLKNL